MSVSKLKSEKKDYAGIILFIVLTFIVSFVYEYIFIMKYLMKHPEYTIASISSRIAVAMMIPSIVVVITRCITGEGFSNLCLNVNFKNKKFIWYVLAWFAPSILTFLGTGLYFVICRNEFSPDMEYLFSVYLRRGENGYTLEALRALVMSQTVTAVLLGPLLNCVTCFGEEWGFRGYLFGKLCEQFKVRTAVALCGVIWGIWYAPLVIVGYNYGINYAGYPYTGIVAICVFCLVIGVFLSFLTWKTSSVIPAIIAHGALNSICSFGINFTKNGGNTFLGPSATGVIGGLPFIIVAVLCIWMLEKEDEIGNK